MKRLQFLILAGILSFTISCGQQKRYVSYTLKQGESIADVAKRLDISTADLLRLNPDVTDKPEVNTVIVIPNPKIVNNNSSNTSQSDNEYVVEEDNTSDAKNDDDSKTEEVTQEKYQTIQVKSYETHEVLPGETVYRITKRYGITKEELCNLNPDFPNLRNNIVNIGQILKVKAIEETVTMNKEEILKNYITHTVKSKETIYGLTRFYNVSLENLIALNPEYPELKNNKLSIGQFLKIKSLTTVKDKKELSFYRDTIAENIKIHMALVLPFKAREYDTLKAKTIFTNNTLGNMATDFYLGAMMAIDSVQKQGISVYPKVFDTGGNRGENIKAIIADDALEDMDVVIGPFYNDKAKELSKKVDIPIVFPHFSKKQKELNSGKIIKAAPEKETYINYLTSYLKEIYQGENIFIIGDGKTSSEAAIKNIRSALKSHESISKIHILKPEDGYIKRERFVKEMSPDKMNWVILASDNRVVISDVLNSMIGLPDDLAVQLFSFAVDKDKVFETIDNNNLADVNFTYISQRFSDTSLLDVQAFYKKYKSLNHALPSEYALKGFDITYDILMRLASGNELTETFEQGMSVRIENKFDYRKKTFRSSINQGLFIVQYNKDLSLKRLK